MAAGATVCLAFIRAGSRTAATPRRSPKPRAFPPTHRYLTDLGDQTTSGQWRDGEALFLRCTVGREVAEHVGESLTRGTGL